MIDIIDKDFSTRQTFKRLWPMIAPFKWGLLLAGFCLILNAAADTSLISLLKPLLDNGFGKNDRGILLKMPFIIIGLIFMHGVANDLSLYSLAWVAGKIVMIMRQKLFDHWLRSPVAFYDKNSTGHFESPIKKDKGTLERERAKGNVEFKNAIFSYPGRDFSALKEINFTIQAGKRVAIVRRFGSGKLTIASLLTRFYDVSER